MIEAHLFRMWTGFGLLVLGVAATFALRRRILFARATLISGTIVSYRVRADSDGFDEFYPLVRGVRPSGEPFEFESPQRSRTPVPTPGFVVDVLVDPENPDRLCISGQQWHLYAIPIMVGVFFVLTGLAELAAITFWP